MSVATRVLTRARRLPDEVSQRCVRAPRGCAQKEGRVRAWGPWASLGGSKDPLALYVS